MAPITTLGHGTLTADAFAALVTGAALGTVVDVRRFPGSRRHPHFGEAAMAAWLGEHGVDYSWLPTLGGRRRPDPASPNVGLRNDQFRAYADHMGSDEFRRGIAQLLEVHECGPAGVMCSESLWWRCHRRLLADHLVLVEEVPVRHLFHDGRVVPHDPLPEAHVVRGTIEYRATA